eukprot:4784659-Prymnesium_polylepis.1
MALKNEVPVIPVLLTGRGYHFDEAKTILQDLPTQVTPQGLRSARARASCRAVQRSSWPPLDPRVPMRHVSQLEQRAPGGLAQLTQQLRRLNAYERLKVSVPDLQATLMDTVPNRISVQFNPAGTESQVLAAVRDIYDKLCAIPQPSLQRRDRSVTLSVGTSRSRSRSNTLGRSLTLSLSSTTSGTQKGRDAQSTSFGEKIERVRTSFNRHINPRNTLRPQLRRARSEWSAEGRARTSD